MVRERAEDGKKRSGEASVLEMARSYVRRGWQVVMIPHGEKGPNRDGWNVRPPTLEELPRWFAVSHPKQPQPNIGLLTGRISGGLVDVDCDTREAALAAEKLLPPTKRISGRVGHPRSHYWYVCADGDERPEGLPRVAFEWKGPHPLTPNGPHPLTPSPTGEGEPEAGDGRAAPMPERHDASSPPPTGEGEPEAGDGRAAPMPERHDASSPLPAGEGPGVRSHKSMLVELRGDRCQTVAPPSIHPSGERIHWEQGGEGDPTVVRYDELKAAVGRVAACALLARSWPAEGTRDEAAMALSGMLLRAEWSVADTNQFVKLVAWIAGDEEWRRRGKARGTLRQLKAGEHAYGQPTLEHKLAGDGAAVMRKVREWLKLDADDDGANDVQRRSTTSKGAHVAEMSAIGVDEHLWRRPLHELRDRTVTWLWEGRIPLGSMTLLDGDPGLGKSLVTLDLIARVTTGREMPDGTDGRDGGAILLSAEDDTEVTIRPRLLAAHADLQRVSAIETVRGVRLESGVEYERSVVLPGDISMLESSIEEIGAKLIVIDPLMAYLDPKVNSWRDQDVRATLAPLARLARHMNVAVLILRHLTKGGGLNALYRGGGSIGIIGAARSGLMIAKDPEHPEHERVLAQTKSNLGPPVTALRYRLAADDLQRAYVQWLGACDHTATSLLLSAAGETVAEPSKLEQAIALLRDECAEGPRSVEELIQRARARNISTITLRRAGDALGVDKGKAGFQGHSLWALPLPPPSLDPAELVAGDGAE